MWVALSLISRLRHRHFFHVKISFLQLLTLPMLSVQYFCCHPILHLLILKALQAKPDKSYLFLSMTADYSLSFTLGTIVWKFVYFNYFSVANKAFKSIIIVWGDDLFLQYELVRIVVLVSLWRRIDEVCLMLFLCKTTYENYSGWYSYLFCCFIYNY